MDRLTKGLLKSIAKNNREYMKNAPQPVYLQCLLHIINIYKERHKFITKDTKKFLNTLTAALNDRLNQSNKN